MPKNTLDSKRLNRTFSLRLSEEEYERLRLASQSQGARSVAELAREAMSRMIDGPNSALDASAGTLSVRLTELDKRLRELSRTVDQLVISAKKPEDS